MFPALPECWCRCYLNLSVLLLSWTTTDLSNYQSCWKSNLHNGPSLSVKTMTDTRTHTRASADGRLLNVMKLCTEQECCISALTPNSAAFNQWFLCEVAHPDALWATAGCCYSHHKLFINTGNSVRGDSTSPFDHNLAGERLHNWTGWCEISRRHNPVRRVTAMTCTERPTSSHWTPPQQLLGPKVAPLNVNVSCVSLALCSVLRQELWAQRLWLWPRSWRSGSCSVMAQHNHSDHLTVLRSRLIVLLSCCTRCLCFE